MLCQICNIRQRCPRLIAGVAPGSSWDVWIIWTLKKSSNKWIHLEVIIDQMVEIKFSNQTFCILSALRNGRVDARQISLLYFLGYLV